MTPNDAALAAIRTATDAAFLRYTRSETETERAINRAAWHALASACSAAHRASREASNAEWDAAIASRGITRVVCTNLLNHRKP